MTCNGSDRPDGSEGVTIELFKESELLVNITKHHLVPQHIVLTNEEKSALLQK
jgi:DNA-directed RNA polymerase I, II, and III subunit RPABC1